MNGSDGLERTAEADVVFVDPDNGIQKRVEPDMDRSMFSGTK